MLLRDLEARRTWDEVASFVKDPMAAKPDPIDDCAR
jgi:hypothetical protein